MIAGLYIRVSTDEQAEEGYSISAQRERLTAYCISQGWEIHDFYIDDGASAKDLDRKELKRLLSDARDQQFDTVLVYRLDRLTRSVLDLFTLLQEFEKLNIKFKSATEVYDTTTAMGRLFITLVAALAQWERENLAERVRLGMEQMVTEGKRPGGPVPFGYDKDGKLIEEEARTIRLLRQLYMDGDGFKTIAQKLNNMGKLRRGYRWGTFSTWYVLDNPYYAGKIRWGSKKSNGKYASRKKEEIVDCIISDGDQEKVFTWEEYLEHTERMKFKSFHGHSKKREYWFNGILYCGKCGSRMSGRYHQNKRADGSVLQIHSYICVNRQEGKGCTMPMFRRELVEQLVMEWIEKIPLNTNKLESEIADLTADISKEKTELAKLQREIEQIRERRKKWQRMYADDLINEDDLRSHNKDEAENEKIVTGQIQALQNQLQEIPPPPTIPMNWKAIWEIADDQDRKELVLKSFDKIVVNTPLEKAHGKKGQFIPAEIVDVVYKQ